MGLLNTLISPGAALASLVLLLIASRVYTYYRLSHIPGPWIAGWTRLWIRNLSLAGNQAREYGALCQKYGPLVRIGPKHLLTDDAELIRQMTNTRSSWPRGSWFAPARFKPREENIVSTNDQLFHDELRKKMAAAYSGKENEMLETTVDDRVTELVDLLERRYVTQNARDERGNARYADLARMSHWFTLDVITALAYGSPLGDLADEADKFGYIDMSENSVGLIVSLGLYPSIWRLMELTRIVDLLLYFSDGLGNIIRSVQPILKKRFAQGPSNQPKDMLGAFIRNGMSYRQIESETTVQLLAGSDTTATAMRSTLLQLMTSPATYRRLTAEIDAAEKSGALSSPATFAEAGKLPYLQACIKEGLRVWPPVCGWNPRVTPPGGVQLYNGVKLPGGVEVGWAPMSMQRQAAIYGVNPDLFVPERWLDASPAQLEAMNRHVDLVFYTGRYKCLGRNVALMELNKVYVELLRRFDLSLVYPAQPWICRSTALWCQKEMWTQVSRREKGEAKVFSSENVKSLELE